MRTAITFAILVWFMINKAEIDAVGIWYSASVVLLLGCCGLAFAEDCKASKP